MGGESTPFGRVVVFPAPLIWDDSTAVEAAALAERGAATAMAISTAAVLPSPICVEGTVGPRGWGLW